MIRVRPGDEAPLPMVSLRGVSSGVASPGDVVTVDCRAVDIVEAFFEAWETLYGMDKRAVLQLRRRYLEAGGSMPITDESIAEVFGDFLAKKDETIQRLRVELADAKEEARALLWLSGPPTEGED